MNLPSLLCFSSFDEVPTKYLEFFDSQNDASFEQTIDWYRALSKILVDDRQSLRLYILVGENDEPLVFFPALLSICKFLGIQYLKLSGLSNYFTANFLPGLNQSYDEKVLARIFCEQLMTVDDHWSVLDINPVSFESSFICELNQYFNESRNLLDRYHRFGNWSQSIENCNFDEYYDNVPSNIRRTIERKEKIISKAGTLKIRIYIDPKHIDKALQEYEIIYANSWKQMEPYMGFIKEIAQLFAEKGCLRLGVLYVNDQPASSQIWFVHNKIASIFKLAYDDSFLRYSVGSILTKELVRYVIDTDKVNMIDYLIGDDKYKKDWMSVRKERFGIQVYRYGAFITYYQRFFSIVKKIIGNQPI